MRIHTDKITLHDLYATAPQGTYPEITSHGSRKREWAFEIGLGAEHGYDAHGNKRSFARNTGRYGGGGDYDRAATWVEWGDWFAALFRIDPNAIIGHYKGVEDYVEQTSRDAEYRKRYCPSLRKLAYGESPWADLTEGVPA